MGMIGRTRTEAIPIKERFSKPRTTKPLPTAHESEMVHGLLVPYALYIYKILTHEADLTDFPLVYLY